MTGKDDFIFSVLCASQCQQLVRLLTAPKHELVEKPRTPKGQEMCCQKSASGESGEQVTLGPPVVPHMTAPQLSVT